MAIYNRVAISGLCCTLISGSAFARPPSYRITDLGTLGGCCTIGRDMNDSGQVTGDSTSPENRFHLVFLWNGTKLRNLGALGHEAGIGTSVNASGQVTGLVHDFGDSQNIFLWDGQLQRDLGPGVGFEINTAGHVTGRLDIGANFHAFFWNGTTMRDLGTLGGSNSVGIAINDSGRVTGASQTTGNAAELAFVWNGKKMRSLGAFGGTRSTGTDINAFGQVAGDAFTTGNSARHAFFWDGTTLHDLGTLGGTHSSVSAMNDFGDVTGSSQMTGDQTWRAFLWDGTAMRDLGEVGGESFGVDVNTAGQVTGSSASVAANESRALLWDGVAMYDLNDLIDPADPLYSRVVLTRGIRINDRGQILARGETDHPGGTFLLTPVLRRDLASFALSESTVAGCLNLTGKVTLTRAAPAGGTRITIKDTLAAANTPISVTIPQGSVSKSFTITTSPVAATQNGTVAAILGGTSLTKKLKVRPIGMDSVTLTPNPVVGGRNVAGTAKLECKAAPGPITVSLSSSNSAVAKPTNSTVVVPAGTQAASFTVRTFAVSANKTATISGAANGVTKSVTLGVTTP
jgi:probable HAF family extracellular repeat protein